MDKETKDRIADFFDAYDLVEFLQVSVEDVVAAFPDEIEEALDEINELMGVGTSPTDGVKEQEDEPRLF